MSLVGSGSAASGGTNNMGVINGSAQGSKPKLTFKFKTPVTTLPTDFLPRTWATLAEAIQCMRARRPSDVTFEELYRLVEDATLYQKSAELLQLIRENVRNRSKELIQSVEASTTTDPDVLLAHVARIWRAYVEETRMLRQIFTHLERWCTKSNGTATTIYDVAIEEFKSQCSPALIDSVVDAVLGVVEQERRGQATAWINKNSGLVSSAVDASSSPEYHHEAVRMLIALQPLYVTVFEPRFLESSRAYLETEALERLRASNNVDDYLLYAASRLAQEASRTYLAVGTKRPLLKIAETCFYADRAQAMCTMGLEALIDTATPSSLQVLARLYNALKSANALTHLRTGFSTFVRARGSVIVVSGAPDTIPQLVELSSRTDRQVKEAFGGDEVLARAARDSCEHYMNLDEQNKAAELLAKYMDRILRKTTQESDAEAELERAMGLFRAVHSKDVFAEFYKQALGKRLILSTSSSDDLERAMISKLKTECGAGFTNKLEGMFRDIDVSNGLVQEWRASRAKGSSSSALELSQVFILSTGHWPSYPEHKTVHLAPELEAERISFEEFYASKFQKGRIVTWRPCLGHCTLRAWIGSSRYELEMSLFQALVLLRLQAGTKTFACLLEETGIPLLELETTLISLSVAKKEQRLLTWIKSNPTSAAGPIVEEAMGGESDNDEPTASGKDTSSGPASSAPKSKPGEKFRPDDAFVVDVKWSSKRARMKINQIQLQETKKDVDDAHESVAQQRHHQIDAAIVRIMKSRKRLSHLSLMTELFAHLPFPAKPQDVKKRIESLIEREYIERVEGAPNEYEYLA